MWLDENNAIAVEPEPEPITEQSTDTEPKLNEESDEKSNKDEAQTEKQQPIIEPEQPSENNN